VFDIVLDSPQLLEQQVNVDHVGQDQKAGNGGKKIASGANLKNIKLQLNYLIYLFNK
jgi:hypothetical protein